MKKARVIIVDQDTNYILPLQQRFVEVFYDQIDLEIITDQIFFESLFALPQKADLLIISEDLYGSSIHRHNIQKVFVMTENQQIEAEPDHNIIKIYKYSSIKEIFEVILGQSTSGLVVKNDSKKEPNIIVVTSASGGTGKTTVAMGLSACLANSYKKVLYLNTDCLQSFQCLLENKTPIINSDVYMKLSQENGKEYSEIKHLLRREKFDYLPPFKSSLVSLGIKRRIILEIAIQAKALNDYDYIVIDTDSCFDEDKINCLVAADKTIVVTNQNTMAVETTNLWVENLDGAEADKYIYVCNRFVASMKNELVQQDGKLRFSINDYIDEIPDYWMQARDKFAGIIDFQKLAMLIM